MRYERLENIELLPSVTPAMLRKIISVVGGEAFEVVVMKGRKQHPPAQSDKGQQHQQQYQINGTQLPRLSNVERARLLAITGWDMEILSTSGRGGAMSPPPSRSSCPQYSLIHLTTGSKQNATKASITQRHDQDRPVSQRMASSSEVVLSCPCCKAKVGLWNYTGIKAAPVGRVVIPSSDGSGTTTLQAPVIDALGMTIAGGSYGAPSPRQVLSPLEGPFGRPTMAGVVPVFGSQQRASMQNNDSCNLQDLKSGGSAGNQDKMKEKNMTPRDAVMEAPRKMLANVASSPSSPLLGALHALGAPWRVGQSGATIPATPTAVQITRPSASTKSNESLMPTTSEGLDALEHHRSWCPWVYGLEDVCDNEKDINQESQAKLTTENLVTAPGWVHLFHTLAGGVFSSSTQSALEAGYADMVHGIKDKLRNMS